MGIRHLAVGALAILATVAAVLVGDVPSDTDGGRRPGIRGAGGTIAELRSFDGCHQLTRHVRQILASADMSQEGVPHLAWDTWGGGGSVTSTAGMQAARGAADGATFEDDAAAAPAPQAGSVSATNVQEVGIDEPDIVETDGRLLLAVTGQELHVVDLEADPEPRLAGSMRLTEGQHQLFLIGERALILTRAWHHVEPLADEGGDAALMPMGIAPSRTELTLVDLRDPSAPSERATATFDGDLVSARATDGTVRLVLRSWPRDVDLRVPVEPSAASGARQHNRAALDRIEVRQILPRMTVQDRAGRTLREGPAVDCTAVSRPAAPSGVGTTTVLTLRPEDGDLIPEDSTSVLADSQIVYASSERLYVATSSWAALPMGDLSEPTEAEGITTEIHAFDTTGAATRHVASGSVEGRLLNQWSLSERDGVLRVAVTRERPLGPAEDGPPDSDSAVVTLTEQGGELAQLGEVDGLGPGEQIHAVRFFDELATVVTFRQIDPLYTVDLSDPTAPRVLGELKIPGFSNYLHPVADGWLLGVGQDADEQGMQLGVQISLFDIRELAAPLRTANMVLGKGHSEVQQDHHAFLWWPDERLAVVPVELWSEPAGAGETTEPHHGPPWMGVVVVEVDPSTGTLRERARITHPEDPNHGGGIRRAAVVDGQLLTVSHVGVQVNDGRSLQPGAWIAF